MIQFKGVNFAYRSDDRSRIILDDVNFRIRRHKVTAIMGTSGCGKTTILRLISGQLKPDSGEVWVDGQLMNDISGSKLIELRRRMGMLFQFGALFTDLSVFENVAFPIRELFPRTPEDIIRDLVLLKLEAVGLRGTADLMPSQLSGGMARRIALARTIILDPDMILYDEPFTGLDPIALNTAAALIKKLNDAFNSTAIMVTHDIQVSLDICDRILFLRDGRIEFDGESDKLRKSTDPFISSFVNANKALDPSISKIDYPARDIEQDLLSTT